MRANLLVVAATAVLGTTNVSVLGALDSGVFRVGATQAPFASETKDMIEFGGVASVLFEDAPQVHFFFFFFFFFFFGVCGWRSHDACSCSFF